MESGEQSRFPDGIFFVSLTDVESPDDLILPIAAAVPFDLYGDGAPKEQLLNFLRSKQMLLVLDNFEYLTDAAEIVAEILRTAPNIKILTTSRQALRLREEWFYSLSGLSYPLQDGDDFDVARLQEYDAVQLFLDRADQARPGFDFAAETACVIQICRLLQGMPLAIELAAAWLRTLPSQFICDELQHGLDLLATELRNIPQRHRSIRATLDHSWRLLNEREQVTLRRISVFRDGFTTAAGLWVTEGTVVELSGLVEKSLLQLVKSNRHQIHDLLRKFSAEKLEAVPEDLARTRARHSTYYLTYLSERRTALRGHQAKASPR